MLLPSQRWVVLRLLPSRRGGRTVFGKSRSSMRGWLPGVWRSNAALAPGKETEALEFGAMALHLPNKDSIDAVTFNDGTT